MWRILIIFLALLCSRENDIKKQMKLCDRREMDGQFVQSYWQLKAYYFVKGSVTEILSLHEQFAILTFFLLIFKII